jgi:alanyl-tRNA synthetase
MTTSWSKEISYLEACYLYDTLGFPYEVTLEYCTQQSLMLNKQKFDNLMSNLQKLSKTTSDFGGDKSLVNLISEMKINKTTFKGYAGIASESKVSALINNDLAASIDKAKKGDEIYVLLDESPFYPEGGGQVGDKGLLSNKKVELEVLDTTSEVDGYIFHKCRVTLGTLSVGVSLNSKVDVDLRNGSKRNHTGTHLLHASLREILGKHVHQQGSLVSPDRLRFDFTHLNKMSKEELDKVEKLMNSKIRANLPVKKHETSYSEAINNGAIAFFGDKYGKDVRTVEISNGSKFSYELCGGTHCEYTGEIGSFYIISESSIASGVRRIEAATGINAENYAKKQFDMLRTISNDLNVATDEIPSKILQFNKQIKDLKKEISSGGNNNTKKIIDDLTEKIENVADSSCIIQEVNFDAKEIRNIAEQLKEKINGIVALFSTSGNKVTVVVAINKSLINKLDSQKIIKEIGPVIGGGGGGKPDMAQAGGANLKGIGEAMELVRSLIKNGLK